MATKKKKRSRARTPVGRQAADGVATPKELMDAIARPSLAEKVALLREIGILDARGKLARKYRSWGNRVSRTYNWD